MRAADFARRGVDGGRRRGWAPEAVRWTDRRRVSHGSHGYPGGPPGMLR